MRHTRYLATLSLLMAAALAEAQLVSGGLDNLAQGASITASSAAGAQGAKYGPQDLADDNEGTWWAANNRPPQWFEMQLPAPQTADTLVLVGADNPTLYTQAKLVIVTPGDGEPVTQELANSRGPFVIRFSPTLLDRLRVDIVEVHDPQKTYMGVAEAYVFSDPDKRVRIKVSPTESWRQIDLTEVPRVEHPCVYHTRGDVAAARQRIQTEPWARAYADSILASADAAVAKPDEWYRQMMPGKGACFAYGFTGCPICRASWGTWGSARCTWDNPGHVTCANGHVLPDAEHPDSGEGYRGPDGRIHYFVGSWNAWVTEKLIHEFAGSCALAYAITGGEKYAAKAALILDLISDIYPSCDKGSWDYPSNPPSGRLARPWYQVARVLVRLVDFYDLIYHSPSLEEPSVTEGLTRRQNIVTNMLKNGAAYCYEQSLHGGLHNGEADYIRGALAVGCLLGIESYVRWAYDGPYGILALVHNNVCRDGRYFETSVSYADHSRELYLTFSEPLWNYRSAAYPNGINLYDDPVFQSFYTVPALSISMLGHSPRFGDSAPDTAFLAPSQLPNSPFDQHLAEMLYARSRGSAREEFGNLVRFLAGGEVEKARAGVPDKEWMLFHAEALSDGSAELPSWLDRRIYETNFFGRKGLVMLRSGRDANAQGALIRFGPSLNHGHLDDLNLNYYGLGYEMTYDLGYSLGSTHTQVGWAKATASHNLVVVDERNQGPDSGRDGSGGSLHLVAGLPGLQVADCSAESTYASLGVTDYRRLTALVGEGRDTYLLDVFHVVGGKQHDYVFHALSDDVDFAGVQFGESAPGSLAGPDMAWGDKQLNDGDMAGYPNKPYWNPPPGNGYGFLMAPQRAPAPAECTATWQLPGNHDPRLRVTMLSEPGTELVTAWAPGIYPERQGSYGSPAGYPKARYLLARRQGEAPLESTYVAVMEPYSRPLPPRTFDDAYLSRVATASAGEVRPIPTAKVLLFKATGPDDELRLPVQVPQTGRYLVQAGVYGSPNYGAAEVRLDGQVLSPLLNENLQAAGGTPLDIALGIHELTAGEHRFTVRVVKPSGENYWIGLQYLSLVPEAEAAAARASEPFLAGAQRLSSPPGTVAVRVGHRSGQVDYLLYRRDGAEPLSVSGEHGEVASDGRFVRASLRGNRVVGLNVIGGSVSVGETRLALAQSEWRGAIARVDYETNRLYTEVALPDDGRLDGEPVYLSNPRYSRNTVYRIAGVRREGSGSVIDLGRSSLVLGFADLDDDPLNDTVLTTLNPHEYSRALGRPDSGFFHGKLLATKDLSVQTTIRATTFGQPFRIEVDSTTGLRQGMRVYYYDVRAGDEFRIFGKASLTDRGDGSLMLQGNCDVVLEGWEDLQELLAGEWHPVAAGGRLPWAARGHVIRWSNR